VIRFAGVSFGYRPHQPVLSRVELEIGAGLTLLVGENGCGKSTLLKLAAGVEQPDAGRIEIDGHDLWREEVAARAGVAFVPEQPDFTPYATVAEVLALVCELRGEPPAAAATALAAVGLDGLARRSLRELSLGQRRRAVLAAALIGVPDHLLLDEPLETLDRRSRRGALTWIEERRAAGALLIVAAHDLAPWTAAAARALTIAGGRCQLVEPLPGDPAARGALLERLARGEPQEPEARSPQPR
jgi:ABC-2 type transport system ATP-binding protein